MDVERTLVFSYGLRGACTSRTHRDIDLGDDVVALVVDKLDPTVSRHRDSDGGAHIAELGTRDQERRSRTESRANGPLAWES